MHYVLKCRGRKSSWAEPTIPDDEIRSWNWITGQPLEDPPDGPIDLEWETESGERLAYYEGNPKLMSRELVEALLAAGVTTLETYEVVIRSNRGKPPTTDYLAVNVVSLVEAADMDASETVEIGRRLRFETLVIDEQKAAGHKLFRLAESSGMLLVDQSVVDQLTALGGFGLTFAAPEDF